MRVGLAVLDRHTSTSACAGARQRDIRFTNSLLESEVSTQKTQRT